MPRSTHRISPLITCLAAGLITTLAIAILCSVCSQHPALSWHRRTEFGAIAAESGVLTATRELFLGTCDLSLSTAKPYIYFEDPDSAIPDNAPRFIKRPEGYQSFIAGRIAELRDLMLATQLKPTRKLEPSPRRIPDNDIDRIYEQHEYKDSYTHSAGWPLPCLATLATQSQGNQPTTFDGILIPSARSRWPYIVGIVIPTTPIWPGLLIDITTWSLAWLLGSLAVIKLKHRLRQRRGLCPRCAYNRLHNYSTPCPECGHSPAKGASP